MKQLSLEILLKRLVTAQREVEEITEEIKRRSDGRRQRTGPRGPNTRTRRKKKQEPRPEEVLTAEESTC